MYNVLLLHEVMKSDYRVKEYLALGGYVVKEDTLLEDSYIKNLRCYDMILIECNKMDLCVEVVEKIRRLVQIPVVVLSERDDEWEKIRLFQLGIDDYLAKPYWQGEFLARAQAHLERYHRLTRPFGIIKVNDLEINVFSRRVTVEGADVELSVKEFDLLIYLAQHMDCVITKEKIYEDVWKDDLADGCYNTIAVHIKRIRMKIEKDPKNPKYIQTVWGVGYLFRS